MKASVRFFSPDARPAKHTGSTHNTEKDMLAQLVDTLQVAVFTCNENGSITFFNAAAAALWGREAEPGKDYWHSFWKMCYINGQAILPQESPMGLTLKTGDITDGEEILAEREDGVSFNLLLYSRPLYDELQRLTGTQYTLADITAKKEGKKERYDLSAIVESSDDAIVSKNLQGIITSWNKGAQKIFGYTEEEIIGRPINTLIPDSLQEEEEAIIATIKAGKGINHYQTRRISKTGKEIHVSLTISPVKDARGNIIGASKIARDISEQLEREASLRHTASTLRILNSIGKAISEKLDVQDILQKVTDATTQISGAAFGAFFYNTVNEDGEAFMLFTLSGAPREAFEKLGMPRNTAIFHPTFSGEGIVRSDDVRKDERYGKNKPHLGMPQGHLPVVSYLAVPVIALGGEVIGGLFFGHPQPGMFRQEHEDLVAGIASQAAVALDNSRLFEEVKALNAKKDEFIALAGHELKTPMTSLKSYLQIMEREQLQGMHQKFVEKSLVQVNKLNLLVSQLLDISKIEAGKLELEFHVFDLRELVSDVADTFRYHTPGHEIVVTDDATISMVRADRQRIEQVVVNLLGNAIKYSPGAGKVYIHTSHADGMVHVSIKDEGIGIDEVQQQNLFSKFYRAVNHPNISGLGIGLYLSKEIIERHNGHISVKSEINKGSEFLFSLLAESL